ncbi:hypothetical protein [Roseibium sediminis]|nr:hypothetical protein [Roseibium sediminis]
MAPTINESTPAGPRKKPDDLLASNTEALPTADRQALVAFLENLIL